MGEESSGGPVIHTYAWDEALYLVQWLNENDPIGSYNSILGPRLLELFGED